MIWKVKISFSNIVFHFILGDHRKFKILTQTDDFDDDLGWPLNDDTVDDDQNQQSSDDNSLRDQFDEGNKGKKYNCFIFGNTCF